MREIEGQSSQSSEGFLIKNSLLRALRASAVKSLLGIRASLWLFASPRFEGCISLLKKVSSPSSWVFLMRAFTVKFALALAVCGSFGCASRTFLPFRFAETTTQQPVKLSPLSFTSVSPALTFTPDSLGAEADLPAENSVASPLSSGESAPSGEVEKKPDKQVEHPKPVKHSEPAPTTLQTVNGPRADDRLLDLVEKDLDRAIEKPAESRRLEFSKAVIENPRVRYFVNYFSRSGKRHFEKILARSGKYLPMISRVLREEGLPNELAYLALI